jgi:hypothetical protein
MLRGAGLSDFLALLFACEKQLSNEMQKKKKNGSAMNRYSLRLQTRARTRSDRVPNPSPSAAPFLRYIHLVAQSP